jgi:Zn-dependent protease
MEAVMEGFKKKVSPSTPMRFTFTRPEQQDLAKSWLLVSLAFAVFMTGLGFSAGFLSIFLFAFVVAAVTVGLGFLAHELSHKYVANGYGCYAEYRADNTMLFLSLLISPFHVFIAAPGAVHISGHPDHVHSGKISLAGPAANIALVLLFLILYLVLPLGPIRSAMGFGAIINSSLALFNLLPFGIFDGAKVIAWDKAAYGLAIAVAVILTFCSFFFVQTQLGLL